MCVCVCVCVCVCLSGLLCRVCVCAFAFVALCAQSCWCVPVCFRAPACVRLLVSRAVCVCVYSCPLWPRQIKVHSKVSQYPYGHVRLNPVHPKEGSFLITDYAKMTRPAQLHVAFQALGEFIDTKGRMPGLRHAGDAAEVLAIAKALVAASGEVSACVDVCLCVWLCVFAPSCE